jgi:Ankyrin repeats (3 copies)
MSQPDYIAEITKAVAARDATSVLAALDSGVEANAWKDMRGASLLHHAAIWGDEKFAEALITRGARAYAHNENGETPADLAAIWGREALAKTLAEKQRDEELTKGHATLGFSSLQDIRAESATSGVNQFHHLAKLGQFPQVITLAQLGGGFTAQDLLGKGPDGDTALQKICEKGQLGLLLKAPLWMDHPEDFAAVWAAAPSNYRLGLDTEGFTGKLRQAKLQSYGKIQIKGLKK